MKTKGRAIIVADLGFGDAGKGTVIDYLARTNTNPLVIRYNGGSQAGHNVTTPEGLHHTFSSFGSGTFVPNVPTHLSCYMLLHPLAMMAEERHLVEKGVTDAFARITLSRDAMLITPFQQAANRLREMSRGDGRHGSCGLGIGETMSDSIDHPGMELRAGDLDSASSLRRKFASLQAMKYCQVSALALPNNADAERELAVLTEEDALAYYLEAFKEFRRRIRLVDEDEERELLSNHSTLLFEGAQGVLIDEWYGFHPYTTWSTTTFANALTLLEAAGFEGEVIRMGITRLYMARHGAGPLVTEDKTLSEDLPESHNVENPWQQKMRTGWLDLVALKYARDVTGGADCLGVTYLDYFQRLDRWQTCLSYRYRGERPINGQFESRDGIITGIRKKQQLEDLDHQERITQALQQSSPILAEHQGGVDEYLRMLEAELGAPVKLTSSGSTFREKVWR